MSGPNLGFEHRSFQWLAGERSFFLSCSDATPGKRLDAADVELDYATGEGKDPPEVFPPSYMRVKLNKG